MRKNLLSLLLVAALGATIYAGSPGHDGRGDHHCLAHDMADCCELAQSKNASPEAMAAKLCCALNCSVPAPTGSAGPHVQPARLAATTDHLTLNRLPSKTGLGSISYLRTSPHPTASPPYIKHLALLI